MTTSWGEADGAVGTGMPPRRRVPWLPIAAVAAFAATIALQLILVITGPRDVGLVILVAATGSALVLAGLGSPVFAVALLLVAAFLRIALPVPILPVEPFVFAFAGVLGSAMIAIARRVNQLPRFGAVEAAMVCYLAWNIGSALAPHTYPATVPSTGEEFAVWRFILTGTMLPFVLYVVGRFVFDRESTVRPLLWVVLGLAAYSAVVSILQFHAPALVWPRFIVDDPVWQDRAVGVFKQPVVNGLVLIIGFVIALFLARQRSEPVWRRGVTTAVAAASVYAIYLTHTRAVWLAFAIVLVAGSIWMRGSRTGFVITLAAATLAIGMSWSTFTSADRDAGGVASTNEVDDRLNIIATSIWAAQEKPVAGWGIGRFSQLNTYHHQQWEPGIEWERGYSLSSHQNELGIAAELGLVGLALWLAVLVLLVRRLAVTVRSLPRDGPCGRDLAIVALFAFVCWLVTGATVDLRFFEFPNALVMLLVGIVVGCADRCRMQPELVRS